MAVALFICSLALHHPTLKAEASKTSRYPDKQNESSAGFTPQTQHLDIKEVRVHHVKSKNFMFEIELVHPIPDDPEITSKYYVTLDLDKNADTGSQSTNTRNHGKDAYISITIPHHELGKNPRYHTGTYGSVLHENAIEIDDVDVSENLITLEIESKWFREHPSFNFVVYNWKTEYGDDDDKMWQTKGRDSVDVIRASNGTALKFPKES